MKRLFWLPSAELALEEIVDYIAIDNLDAALALGDRIVSAIESNLPEHPNMGRPGRVEGTRELVVHRNYIVVYRVKGNDVIILDVVHAAQMYPEEF